MTQNPLFDLSAFGPVDFEPLGLTAEYFAKTERLAEIQQEINWWERKRQRLLLKGKGAWLGPTGDYNLKMLKRCENKLKKLNERIKEVENA